MADKDFKVKHGIHVPEAIAIGNESPVVSLDMTGTTDAIALPKGTTDQRPATGRDGMLRYNTDRNEFEAYSTPKGGWALMTTEGSSVDAYTFGGYRPEYFLDLVNSTNILPTARLVGRYDNVTDLNAVGFHGLTKFFAKSAFGANGHGRIEINGMNGAGRTGLITGNESGGRTHFQIYGSGQLGGYTIEMEATDYATGGWHFTGDVNITGKLTATSYDNLGLGSISLQNANLVNITGGSINVSTFSTSTANVSTVLNVTGLANVARGVLTNVDTGATSMVNRGFVETFASNASNLSNGLINAARIPHLHYDTNAEGEAWITNSTTGIGSGGAVGVATNGALTYRYAGVNRVSFDSNGTMTIGTIPIARVSGLETALATYAPLNSPALTGVPTAPTAAISTNTVQIATTAFVQNYGNTKVSLSGDSMTGFLTLHADPTSALHAATRRFVEAQANLRMPFTGGAFTGFITLYGDPTAALHPTSKQYVDSGFIAKSSNTVTNSEIAVFDGTTGVRVRGGRNTIADLLNRQNHTGSQLMTTITGLNAALDGKENKLSYVPINKAGDNLGEGFFYGNHGSRQDIAGTFTIPTTRGNYQWLSVTNNVVINTPTIAGGGVAFTIMMTIDNGQGFNVRFATPAPNPMMTYGDVRSDGSLDGAGNFLVVMTVVGGNRSVSVVRSG